MINYKDFFNQYRNVEVKSDDDLLFQVGWTIGQKPITAADFDTIINVYTGALKLNGNDHLMDLCCGNGVITHKLSERAKQVIAIDFSDPYISNADKMKSGENIKYYEGNVTEFENIIENELLLTLKQKKEIKILMSNSLGYFDIHTLTKLLTGINNNFKTFSFYISGIPDYDKHQVIFNSLSKKISFLFNDRLLGKTQAIGRFWKRKEIESIAKKFNFKCTFDTKLHNVPGHAYRLNVLIEKE